jgi:uncharacterized membrane protein HdeD (DUF308 family)
MDRTTDRTMDVRGDTWLLVLRGVVAIVFGALAIVWPGLTILVLALLFAAYVLVDGLVTVVLAFRHGQDAPRRVARVLIGLLSVAAGVVALVWPGITALVLVVLVGAWAVVTGLLEIFAASRAAAGWWSIVVGIASLAAGVLILANPRAGAYAIALVIGVYAIIAGVLLLAQAWRLHRLGSGAVGGHAARAGA